MKSDSSIPKLKQQTEEIYYLDVANKSTRKREMFTHGAMGAWEKVLIILISRKNHYNDSF